MMNAQELYDELKEAIDYFGLGWRDKAEIEVMFNHDEIVFTYEHRRLSVRNNRNDQES